MVGMGESPTWFQDAFPEVYKNADKEHGGLCVLSFAACQLTSTDTEEEDNVDE
jgi:hypothetical protein